MKTFILVICLLANVAWAEADGGIQVVPRAPHLQERFQFQTTLFLDRATFGRRHIFLLDLKGLISRTARARGDGAHVKFRMDHRREGTLIPIEIEASAGEMQTFFDDLLKQGLLPLAHLMSGYGWLRSSAEYQNYWLGINDAIKRDIEIQALVRWSAKRKNLSAAELCEQILKLNRD